MMDQLINLLISNAYAETPAGISGMASQGGGYSFIIMLVIFFIFIYFAIWRPQNKRAKEQRDMLSALAKGDEIVTAGGILGRINKISDPYIVLAISDSQEILMQKSSVVTVLPKGTMKTIQ